LVTALLLFLMVWSFGSSAANNPSKATVNEQLPTNEAGLPAQNEEEDQFVDADLGKWAGQIDRAEYLRLRSEYIGRKRGIEPGRPFDPEMRNRAIQQMDRQEKDRKLESLVNGSLTPPIGTDAAWTSIGPTSILNGQPLSGGNTSVSGRVTAIVVDPTNANNVYLGTAQGGVWRSQDGGTSWTPIFDGADSLAIGALALAPSDPSILYVGTGEFNGCGDCFFGVGLYRIDQVNSAPSLVGPMNPQVTVSNFTYKVFSGRGITKIVVDPTNPATVFVSTGRGVGGSGASSLGLVDGSPTSLATRGLWRSTNATSAAASVNFQKLVVTMDNSPDTPQTGNVDTTDIAMEPGNPNNLLVAVIGQSNPGTTAGGIYRTTNALAGTPIFTQVLSTPFNVRTNLAINKVGSIVTAYAATSETPNSSVSPGCSSSGTGLVRKQVDPFNLSSSWVTQLPGGAGFCGGQCFYNIAIAVNPTNASEVYLGGNARGSCSDGMKRSIDGGATFNGGSSSRDDIGLHADSHALYYDATGTTIFAGNDGGVWKRSASAATGTAWTNLNNGLNTLQFESIAVHPTDRNLMIGGTQDNGTEYQITSAGNWSNAEGGDGGYTLIDQSATDTTKVTMYHTFFNQTGTQIGFDRALDTTCLPMKDYWPTRGVGFGSSNNLLVRCAADGAADYIQNGLTLTDNVLFYAPMALGPGSPNTVYFGTDRLYRSIDRGDTMTIVSQSPITGSPISSIAIWPGGDNLRMVGLQSGQVWATSTGSSNMVNLTQSFSFPVNPNGSLNKFVGRALIDPNNKNVAYVTLSYFAPAGQGIWKITNLAAASGAAAAAPVWTAASSGIPSIPINGLAIDPLNSNDIYAGTDIGVYVSTDGGASWNPFGTGLPRSAVFDLQIQPSNRILRAATHGRGVWETPLISPGASTVQFSAGTASVNESQVSTTVTVTRAGDTSFPAQVNYATSDAAGANNCNVNNGSASARCDYIATSGTLNFAANETSKNILIPIVDDAYLEGPESFTMTLSAAAGSNVTLGGPSSITVTINDDETGGGGGGTNQIDSSSFFVREHYIDFLNREPDAGGLNFWTNNINNCTPQPSCTEITRINTSAAFFISIEFQDTGYFVYRIYKAAYGDATGNSTLGGAHTLSVPIIRLNEFLPDTQRIGQGVVVGQGNWQQQIDDNKTAFAEEFVQRSRFLTDYPLTLPPAQFVDKLNQRAATGSVMPLTTAQRDQLVADVTAGIKTRAQAVRAVAENQTLYNAEYNRAFVLMQFFGYLRRNPNDPQDTDYAGYDFWLGKLNQFGGNFVNAEMVKSFIVSSEYRQRFGN
jgi:hypothetical protein